MDTELTIDDVLDTEDDHVGKTGNQLERARSIDFHRGSPHLLALDTVRLVESLSRAVDGLCPAGVKCPLSEPNLGALIEAFLAMNR
jgi:hypothetical protein